MSVVAKNLWATIKELLIEQYRGDLHSEIEAGVYIDRETGLPKNYSLPDGADNRFQGLLKSVIDMLMQPLDDASISLRDIANIDEASGAWLDILGKFVGISRSQQETDKRYRERIKQELSNQNAGTPDGVIYTSALLSSDPKPQYMDESPATFFVYDGPRYEGEEWKNYEARQLSHSELWKNSPAGVLGLPGAAIQFADGTLLGTYASAENERKLLLAAANDKEIVRDVLLADNFGNILVSPQSTPIRVLLRGAAVPSIPTIETTWNDTPVDAVRIKDLPDAGEANSYMVRDSESEGTVKVQAMNESALDELWDSTPAEGEV